MTANEEPERPFAEATTSRLLELPPELRNYVYELSVVSNTSIVIEPGDKSTRAKQPPLILVNRQIRSEALLIFYAQNTFEFDASECGFVTAKGHWLQLPPGSFHLLKRVIIRTCCHEASYYLLDLEEGLTESTLTAHKDTLEPCLVGRSLRRGRAILDELIAKRGSGSRMRKGDLELLVAIK